MNRQVCTIEIYSDVICPWCYVGKRRLERALSQVTDAMTPRIIWRPFQLNPTMPKSGMVRKTYLEAKFGSLAVFSQMEEQLLAAGAEEQIGFAFQKIERTPNTVNAHRLIWYAEQQGCQDAVVESLFQGYFIEGADIGSVQVLSRLAGGAGLEIASVESFFQTDEGTNEVKHDEAVGRALGIRGVPYFVLNGAYAISGAQPPDLFVAALKKVEADQLVRKAGE
jgi:predicted DsbA family dithiol-disulfide isomerase